MASEVDLSSLGLPPEVQRVLTDFVAGAVDAFQSDLHSIILYGSAAEGRVRATSDINVILILTAFERERAQKLRDVLRAGQAAVQIQPMFVLRAELEAATEAFAQKFADVLRRHKVLYGEDPFAGLAISRQAKVKQLRQQLLNLTLRLRASYMTRSSREEQMTLVIADAAGPLRSCAAAQLELEGKPYHSPKEALQNVAASLGESDWTEVLSLVSTARETRSLPPGKAEETGFRLIELARRMFERAEDLS